VKYQFSKLKIYNYSKHCRLPPLSNDHVKIVLLVFTSDLFINIIQSGNIIIIINLDNVDHIVLRIKLISFIFDRPGPDPAQ